MLQHDNVIPLHRGAQIIHIPSRNEMLPLGAPARQEKTSRPVEPVLSEPSLFDLIIDVLADFVADIASMPGTALALIFFGQFSVMISVLLWAVLS